MRTKRFVKEVCNVGMRRWLVIVWSHDVTRSYFISSLTALMMVCVVLPIRIQELVTDGVYRSHDGYLIAAHELSLWFMLFYFLQATYYTGPTIVMILKMLWEDLAQFIFIYVVILVGFAQAFQFLFAGVPGDLNVFKTWEEGMFTLLLCMLGDFRGLSNPGAFQAVHHPDLVRFLFVVYLTLAAVLLINLLIALMANTFTRVSDSAGL